jgi:hypothetical protein
MPDYCAFCGRTTGPFVTVEGVFRCSAASRAWRSALVVLCQVEGRPVAQAGAESSASHAPPRRSQGACAA